MENIVYSVWKKRIIVSGALIMTGLAMIPRFLVALIRTDLRTGLSSTMTDLALRAMVLFCFSWLVLSFNICWKNEWPYFQKSPRFLKDMTGNFLLLLMGIGALLLLKYVFVPIFIDLSSLFFVILFNYLIVLLILLPSSLLVNLYFEGRQRALDQ